MISRHQALFLWQRRRRLLTEQRTNMIDKNKENRAAQEEEQ